MSSLATINSTVLPMMRRVVPQLIAQDICGVQPMTGPTGTIFALNTLDSMIEKFEKYTCDIVDIIRLNWPDAMNNPAIWRPCTDILFSLCHKQEITKETLDETNEKLAELFVVIDDMYPDLAFDLQMRGYNGKWRK